MSQNTFVVPSNVAAFVLKLWKLVEDPNVDEMISWSKEGTAFCVHDPVSFAKDVLPHYFKHNNFTSFVRQLNMYGFKKLVSTDHGGIKSDNPEWEFHHPYFAREKSELLELVKRKVHPEEKKIKSEDVSHVIEDVQQLREKHGVVQSQLENLKMQNEMLWRELTELRMKHHKQQHVLNKLIKFLILIYGRKGVKNRKRLAIEQGQPSTKRRRSSGSQAQVEELESLKYVVESPKAVDSVLSNFDIETTSSGPQITLLPDEPLVQDITSKPVISTDQARDSSIALQTASTTKTKKRISQTNSKPKSEDSLKLKMPTMVSLSKEPTLDFSPSIFDSPAPAFPSHTNMPNAAVSETLEELENSFNPSSAVVLKRSVSADKDVIDQDVDHITSSLDSLQGILSGPQFNLDADTLLQLFNSEENLSAPTTVPYQTSKTGSRISNDYPLALSLILRQAITAALEAASADPTEMEEIDGHRVDENEDMDGLSPFSPGMFLNDDGELANEQSEKH
ncbi:heat shock factor protein-like isoform X2 [Rhopilema esculentum]|uniref:heat shock factor protein-like isoform X2 n=1 Tax=Rhopilema esculentum TaxID=499914 RepID=UPI0031DAECC6